MFKEHREQIRTFMKKVGHFQTRLLFSVVYFVLVVPMGLIIKLFSDPLRLRYQSGSGWTTKNSQTDNPENARRQF